MLCASFPCLVDTRRKRRLDWFSGAERFHPSKTILLPDYCFCVCCSSLTCRPVRKLEPHNSSFVGIPKPIAGPPTNRRAACQSQVCFPIAGPHCHSRVPSICQTQVWDSSLPVPLPNRVQDPGFASRRPVLPIAGPAYQSEVQRICGIYQSQVQD